VDSFQVFDVFVYVSAGSVLAPMACFLIVKGKNKVAKVLFVLLLASLASDIGNELYVRAGFRGYLILNIFFVTQIILLSQIFALLLERKKGIYVTLALFLVFGVLDTILFQPINEYQNVLRLVGGVMMISFSVYYYFIFFAKPIPTIDIFRFSPGWIVTAVFYYFSYNLFLFVFANYVFRNETREMAMLFWGFHGINNIIKNSLFTIGIYYGVK